MAGFYSFFLGTSILALCSVSKLSGQSRVVVRIAGAISDPTGKPVTNANIKVLDYRIKGREVGTFSNTSGDFLLFVENEIPFEIEISHVGFEKQIFAIKKVDNLDLKITLQPKAVSLEEVVVLSDRLESRILRSEISIDEIDIKEVQQSPSFDIYDLVAGIKEVQVSTQSLTFNTINSRGFNTTANPRFIQLVDGFDIQAPGFNFPLGNFLHPSELDVEGLSLIPGPSTSEYGSNGFNGILLINTKNPFDYEGLSANVKLAANRFTEGGGGDGFFDIGGEPVYDLSLRYAKAFYDKKLAFKINLNRIRGTDWAANNEDNIGAGEIFERHPVAPGYDGLNTYGDEIQAELPIGSSGNPVLVTRDGYLEEDLVDYNIRNNRVQAQLSYRPWKNMELSVEGRYGEGTSVFTSDNRISLNGFNIWQIKSEIKAENLLIRGYKTSQNTGNSYDSRFLAFNLNRTASSDEEWFRTYENAFLGNFNAFGIPAGDHESARNFANLGFRGSRSRIIPGTEEFEFEKQRIINTTGFSEGAKFIDRSSLYHLDVQYDASELWKPFKILIGGNYRFYDLNSEGTVFPDSLGLNLSMFEYGLFSKLSRDLSDQFILNFSFRLDNNENFDPVFTPRAGINYNPSGTHNFRLNYQTGSRIPSLREQFTNQDIGAAKLVGGLPELLEPLNIAGNSFTTQSVEEFNDAVSNDITFDPETNQDPLNIIQSRILNYPILESGIIQQNQVNGIEPERIRTIELGYRSVIKNRLIIDINYFLNRYENFIGVLRVIRPRTSPEVDQVIASSQLNNSTEREVFFINANSRDIVTAQGVAFNFDWTSKGGVNIAINGTWSKLTSDSDDPVIPGFNTPTFKSNYSLGVVDLFGFKNLGAKFILRARSSFDWQSNFADGEIKEFVNTDFQFNYKFEKLASSIKLGASNIGNEFYTNTFGGPSIGVLWYLSMTFDSNLLP